MKSRSTSSLSETMAAAAKEEYDIATIAMNRHFEMLLKERNKTAQQKHGERVEARQKQNEPD